MATDEEKSTLQVQNSAFDDNVETVMEVRRLRKETKHELALWPAIVDFTICSIVATIITVVPHYLIEPPVMSFRCDDISIAYPVRRSETTNITALGFSIFFLTVIPVLIGEILRMANRSGTAKYTIKFTGSDIIICLSRFFSFVGCSILGLLMNGIFCVCAKYSFGRYRPTFLHTCVPRTKTFCDKIAAVRTPLDRSPVEDGNFLAKCRVVGLNYKDIRLSFFSAYASLAMHAAVYSVLYIEARYPRRFYGHSPRVLLELALILVALFIGYSRAVDRANHLSDVFVGFAVGTATALFAGIRMADLFHKNRKGLRKKKSERPDFMGMPVVPVRNQNNGEVNVEMNGINDETSQRDSKAPVSKNKQSKETKKAKEEKKKKETNPKANAKDLEKAKGKKNEKKKKKEADELKDSSRPTDTMVAVPDILSDESQSFSSRNPLKDSSSVPRKLPPFVMSAASEKSYPVDIDSIMK